MGTCLLWPSETPGCISDDREDQKSQTILKELENIDDEADEHDLPFIKIDDDQAR